MNMVDQPGLVCDTSAITVLSSAHGRLRRAQRAIEKRDLKVGTKFASTGVLEVTDAHAALQGSGPAAARTLRAASSLLPLAAAQERS